MTFRRFARCAFANARLPLLRQPPALVAERVVDLGVDNSREIAVGQLPWGVAVKG